MPENGQLKLQGPPLWPQMPSLDAGAARSISMPETRDAAVPSGRAQQPSLDSQHHETSGAALDEPLWQQLRKGQEGNAGHEGEAGQVSKGDSLTAKMGYYQEHGPRRFGDEVKRQPTLEERFWQFTPDVPESEDSDDSAEERELVSLPDQLPDTYKAIAFCSQAYLPT